MAVPVSKGPQRGRDRKPTGGEPSSDGSWGPTAAVAEGRHVAVMSDEVRPGVHDLLHHVLQRDSNSTLPKVLANCGGTRLHVGDNRSLRQGLSRCYRGYATE